MNKDKRTYYTNGVNEVRLYDWEEIPDGWVKGRLKSTVTTLGSRWYNDGTTSMLLSSDDIVPEGFVPGRIYKKEWSNKIQSSLISGKFHYYNNGVEEIKIPEGDKIPDGFVPGRLPMTDEQKKKLSESHMGLTWSEETKMKSSETKRRNGSFSTSKPEVSYYEMLCKEYGASNVLRHYNKDERYPYHCDFYIKSTDTFIELNLHWTHGGRPFDTNDEWCQKKLAFWKEKAKVSNYYQCAIDVWTVTDVKKLETATKNKINFICLYKLDK